MCRLESIEFSNVISNDNVYKLIEYVDPLGSPLKSLAILSCKSIVAREIRNVALLTIIRKLAFDLYAVYSQALRVVLSENREGIIVHSAGCRYDVKVSIVNHEFKIKVNGCNVKYSCSCSVQQGGPGHRLAI